MKIGRNEPCWCGSGKKYKACHMAFDDKIEVICNKNKKITRPTPDMIKTPEQLDGIRRAGEINSKILDAVAEHVKEGVSTGELDRIVAEKTKELGGIPAPLNYEGFPKSVCTSINDVVCHGIPDDNRFLEDGDIVNIDCTTIYEGYYGDASRMFMIGDVDPLWVKLVEITKECLDEAVKIAQPWTTLGDFGYLINKRASDNGFSVVREIGGHGCGVDFHEDPWVPHIGKPDSGCLIVPGMSFTIEPMINVGKPNVYCDSDDGWTIYTDDGSPSAQWEYHLIITENGNEIVSC